MNSETEVPKSNGQKFKELNGYSKTLQRNMRKKGLNPVNIGDIQEYKAIRKKRKKAEQILGQDRARKHRAERMAKPKKTTAKAK